MRERVSTAYDDLLVGLNDAQRVAAEQQAPCLVIAGAGSGITSTLTARVMRLLGRDQLPPERLLCITFTNKAAAEMRKRIAARIGADHAPSWVGTFHAIAARLLREDGRTVAGLLRASPSWISGRRRQRWARCWGRKTAKRSRKSMRQSRF
ncbi:UvrD-helicase domain-containing protein [Siccirubricoccus deserti]